MPPKFAAFIRVWCVAGALVLCVAGAAERKSPLIGITRDELLSRLGEPKSHITAGSREIVFFPHERVVLRDNRVVEVETLAIDAPASAPAPAVKPAAPTTVRGTPGEPGTSAPADNTPDSAHLAPSVSKNSPADASSASVASNGAVASASPAALPPPPEPEVVIKSVRPPSRTTVHAESRAPATQTSSPSASSPVSDTSKSAVPAVDKAALEPQAATATPATVTPTPVPPPATPAPTPADGATDSAAAASESFESPGKKAASLPTETAANNGAATPSVTPGDAVATETSSAPKQTKPERNAPVVKPDQPQRSGGLLSNSTTVVSVVAIIAGIAFLVWRRRQKDLALEATSVSVSPFTPEPVAPVGNSRFTADLLNQLEWKRFEELVAAYYNKTGVVASRTKSGPEAPVHIRISWKGEQRPFACVQCIPHPRELVGPKAIQSLCEVTAAEDIRRGYIVTSGKFGVPARDLAEEKHITLLPGDIFLEKLNALPEVAKAELLKDATTGDYTTPTCPRCDIKMTRSDSGWQCVQCGTVLPPS